MLRREWLMPVYSRGLSNMEQPIVDKKGRQLSKGDLVILANVEDLVNDDLYHAKGDVLQFIGGNMHNIGCFIHCKTKQRTDFFADRTLKINIKQS